MDESIQASSSDPDKDQSDRSQVKVDRENSGDEKTSRVDDRSGRGQPTVDIAEVLRRWTHALQRIHKQSLHLV